MDSALRLPAHEQVTGTLAPDRYRQPEPGPRHAEPSSRLVGRGLRAADHERLARVRPATLGQAGRLAGVSPADVHALMVLLRRPAASEAD